MTKGQPWPLARNFLLKGERKFEELSSCRFAYLKSTIVIALHDTDVCRPRRHSNIIGKP